MGYLKKAGRTGGAALLLLVLFSSFIWDSADSYIDLRSGSLTEYPVLNGHAVPSLAAGACTTTYTDFYYEVEITRNASAYNHTRSYHITATADNVSGQVV